MNFATLLGVVVGLAFVYLLLSLVCSTIQEWIAAILRRRAATLREGLIALVQDPATVEKLYQHSLVKSLVPPKHAQKAVERLAYLPSSVFATALLENVVPAVLTPGVNLSATIQAANIPAHLKASLIALADRAGANRDRFIDDVEKWFDDTMDRVSGWYKRRTQVVIIVLAVIVTLVMNVDSIRVAEELYHNAGLREAVNAAAHEYLAQNPQGPATPADDQYAQRLQGYVDSLTVLNLPIGWKKGAAVSWELILGWVLTIVAVSLGAPFWFDVLLRIANLRANGPKPPRGDRT